MFDPLIQKLDVPDDEVRFKVREALVKIGVTVVESLIAAMQVGTIRLSWQAAVVLGQIPDPRWIIPMRTALESPNILLGQAAVDALENALGQEAVTPFLEALPRCGLVVQMSLIKALERLKDIRSIKPLSVFLESTESPELRYTIIEALGVLGDPDVIPLINKFQNDANQHVQERVMIALEQLIERSKQDRLTIEQKNAKLGSSTS